MNKLQRTKETTIGDAIKEYLKQARLSSGYNTQRIFSAWDDASGAGAFTTRKYFREGKLYITLNSSVICNQLSFQKQSLIEKINAILEADSMYIKDDKNVGYVKELILK